MRVQLKNQALRLRIDEPELARLLAGDSVDNATHWPDGTVSHQRVRLAEEHAWQRDQNGWCLRLAESAVQQLAARLPSREGLEFELAVPGGEPLHVLFDVDVRDSARRRHPKKTSAGDKR